VNQDRLFLVQVRAPGLPEATRSIEVLDTATQVEPMQVKGLLQSAREGQTMVVTITTGRQPLAGVEIQWLSTRAVTDQDGRAVLQAPLVNQDLDSWITLLKPGYMAQQASIRILDTGAPKLVLVAPAMMEGGRTYELRVAARDETGKPLSGPVIVTATIEAQRAELRLGNETGAAWSYHAPRLVRDAKVFVFARADGYEPARLLVTIRGAR
jgi:hypothetical protein